MRFLESYILTSMYSRFMFLYLSSLDILLTYNLSQSYISQGVNWCLMEQNMHICLHWAHSIQNYILH